MVTNTKYSYIKKNISFDYKAEMPAGVMPTNLKPFTSPKRRPQLPVCLLTELLCIGTNTCVALINHHNSCLLYSNLVGPIVFFLRPTPHRCTPFALLSDKFSFSCAVCTIIAISFSLFAVQIVSVSVSHLWLIFKTSLMEETDILGI